MGFTKRAAEIWRDFVTTGVPSSGVHQPLKSEIRQWGTEIEGAIPLSPLSFGAAGDGTTDDIVKWNDLVTYVGTLTAAGRQHIVIDGGGRSYALSSTLVFGSGTADVHVQNCKFIPLGATGDWTESDSGILTYWKRYQTFGSTWITQKPLIKIGSGNAGFMLRDCTIDCGRICAGVYVLGNNKSRIIQNVGIDNVRSYAVYQTGSCKLNDVKIRINTDVSGTRDAYGVAYDAVDTHWNQVTIQWGYCPLLTTGATLMMVDCDIFNGNDSSPVTNPRLWEHRGNTVTWLGGRLGNGVIHAWSTDLAIQPAKIGITGAASITQYFRLYATAAAQKITGFLFYPAEIPQELRSGSTNMFGFYEPQTFTANTVNGSVTLSNVSSVDRLAVGMAISGTGITGGTVISEIDSVAMTITMSAVATAGGTGITVTPTGTWDANTVTALQNKNGYWNIVPRGVSIIAVEDNNVYPVEIINAPGTDDALIRFKAGGTAVVPEIGLRNALAWLGYSSSLGWAVGADGSLRNSNAGTGPGVFTCTGTPEAQITAPVGSICLRTDGGAGTSLYVKQTGTGNTGWVGK